MEKKNISTVTYGLTRKAHNFFPRRHKLFILMLLLVPNLSKTIRIVDS